MLRGGDRGAGAGLDEPGRRDGRAHRRRQAAAGATARGEQQDRYLPRMATGEIRATMALTEPGGGSDLQALRTTARRDGDDVRGQRVEDVDHQRPPVPAGRAAVQDRSRPPTRRTAGISILLVETGPGLPRLARPAQARLQGRGELRAGLRRLPGARRRRCSATREGAGVRADDARAWRSAGSRSPARALGVGAGRAGGLAAVRPGAGELRQADLAAPVGRQPPRRHGHQAGGGPAARAVRRPPSTTPASAPTWRPAWRSCSRPRPRWRSR